MKIIVPPETMLVLESWCATAEGLEVSGLGQITYDDATGDFKVGKIWLMDVGSEVFTQIEPEKIMQIYSKGIEPASIKLWWHRHPVGDGRPGGHCWSGTDENTIQHEPLGSTPEMVKWSVSMVRTPLGWVGRVDHYEKKRTMHLEVTQPLRPEDHHALHQIYQVKNRARMGKQALNNAVKRSPQPTATERRGIVDQALVAINRVGKRKVGRGPIQDWVKRKMGEYGIDEQQYSAMRSELASGVLTEQVSEDWRVDLMTMRELELIDWDEMGNAMTRKARNEMDEEFEEYQDRWDHQFNDEDGTGSPDWRQGPRG